MSVFTFVLFMGALGFAAFGWYARAWTERGRRENARGGYITDTVHDWSPPPFDQEAYERQFADALDKAAGQ